MKKMKLFQMLMSLVLTMTLLCGISQAALKAVGPVDLVTSIPVYYQDTTNLALMPCLDQNGMCLLPPPFDTLSVPMSPITTVGPINNVNFPGEGFYYSAVALMRIEPGINPAKPLGELANLAYVLEYAFLAGVSPNLAITFLRTDLQKMIDLMPNSTYRVTHPYGTFDFTTDNAGNARGGGGVVLRQEDPPGGAGVAVNYFTPSMKAAVNTNIGPYLRPADGILLTRTVNGTTHTYLGDPAATTIVNGVPVVGVPVTGGTNGNIFQIDRILTNGLPVTGKSWSTNLFSVSARVFTGTAASPMTIDRTTYARDAATGQIDVFVTAETAAALTLSGTGIPSTPIDQDVPNTGKFFVNIPFTTVIPTALSITNSLDFPTPIPHPLTLVDEVNITEANYNQVTKVLTVKAASRDQVAPLPTLTVAGFAAPNTLDTTGTFTTTLTSIPPQHVTVTSTRGGSATAPISVGVVPLFITTADPLPGFTSGVLYNQTIAFSGGVAPYAWSATAIGTLPPGINFFPATGNLFGVPTTAGTYSFTLQLSDSLGTTAIKPFSLTGVTPPNPVAVNDTATTPAGTTVVISVLANDTSPGNTLNPASLSVSAATGGAATPNLNGTVSYTAPSTPGNYSFSYTVKDTAASPFTSNIASVEVTVTTAPLVIKTVSKLTPYILGTSTYTTTLAATGGNGAYSWSVQAGSTLPAGLTLTTAGVLSGTPTTAGTYLFTIRVTDSSTPTTVTATQLFSIDISPPLPSINVALQANGGVATASSTLVNPVVSLAAVNDGDRKGIQFWADSTPNTFPDWVQITFDGLKSINEIDVFTVQDNYLAPVVPFVGQTFTLYGANAFDVQYWDGLAWVNVPGGSITANNQIWTKITFPSLVTDRIRVQVNAASLWSRIAEIEAYTGPAPPPPPINVALQANGGVATASSTLVNPVVSLAAVNDGDRKGIQFWADSTPNTFPDWVQITFNGLKSISEIDVFTVQDNYLAPVVPFVGQTFTLYGANAFDVQYWDGLAWVNVPGGSITANNQIWTKITFPSLVTDRIRVQVNAASLWSRIAEIEAR